MPNKEAQELRALDDHTLALRLQEAQNDLMGTRFGLATRQMDNSAHLGIARRRIARIKTIMREREEEALAR